MFASRSHLDENAMTSPYRSRSISPHKGTAGKQRQFGENGNENDMVSPKKLFTNMKSPQKGISVSATPGPSKSMMKGSPTKGNAMRSALGDKTNNNNHKTPHRTFNDRSGQEDHDGSPKKRPTKEGKSPTKKGKATMMDPQTPSALHVTAKSLQTPVANIGQMGMMKQRMAEYMDAQRMGEQMEEKTQLDEDVSTKHWSEGLTEEQMYPEIEYLPPRHLTRPDLHDQPLEFDELTRPADLAKSIARPRFASLADENSDVKVEEDTFLPPIGEMHELVVTPHEDIKQKPEEDTTWPDEVVEVSRPLSTASTPRSTASSALASSSRLSSRAQPIRTAVKPSTSASGPRLANKAAPSTSPTRPLAKSTSSTTRPALKSTSSTSSSTRAPLRATSTASSTRPPVQPKSSTTSSTRLLQKPTTSTKAPLRSSTTTSTHTKSNPTTTSRKPLSNKTNNQSTTQAQRRLHPALRNLEDDTLSQLVLKQLNSLDDDLLDF
ncbi:unnamed protein product [Sympodiomycopsis kandeliae]